MKDKKNKNQKKIFSKNKKALHEYEVLETIEAGIKLQGNEVKKIRNGMFHLVGSYAKIEENKVILIGSDIDSDQRDRVLLLNKSEINKYDKKLKDVGLTLIVLDAYQIGNKPIKVTLSLAKGKKNYDKRASLKAKTQKMEANRAIKGY